MVVLLPSTPPESPSPDNRWSDKRDGCCEICHRPWRNLGVDHHLLELESVYGSMIRESLLNEKPARVLYRSVVVCQECWPRVGKAVSAFIDTLVLP